MMEAILSHRSLFFLLFGPFCRHICPCPPSRKCRLYLGMGKPRRHLLSSHSRSWVRAHEDNPQRRLKTNRPSDAFTERVSQTLHTIHQELGGVVCNLQVKKRSYPQYRLFCAGCGRDHPKWKELC